MIVYENRVIGRQLKDLLHYQLQCKAVVQEQRSWIRSNDWSGMPSSMATRFGWPQQCSEWQMWSAPVFWLRADLIWLDYFLYIQTYWVYKYTVCFFPSRDCWTVRCRLLLIFVPNHSLLQAPSTRYTTGRQVTWKNGTSYGCTQPWSVSSSRRRAVVASWTSRKLPRIPHKHRFVRHRWRLLHLCLGWRC